jgi:hypothetical protein
MRVAVAGAHHTEARLQQRQPLLKDALHEGGAREVVAVPHLEQVIAGVIGAPGATGSLPRGGLEAREIPVSDVGLEPRVVDLHQHVGPERVQLGEELRGRALPEDWRAVAGQRLVQWKGKGVEVPEVRIPGGDLHADDGAEVREAVRHDGGRIVGDVVVVGGHREPDALRSQRGHAVLDGHLAVVAGRLVHVEVARHPPVRWHHVLDARVDLGAGALGDDHIGDRHGPLWAVADDDAVGARRERDDRLTGGGDHGLPCAAGEVVGAEGWRGGALTPEDADARRHGAATQVPEAHPDLPALRDDQPHALPRHHLARSLGR